MDFDIYEEDYISGTGKGKKLPKGEVRLAIEKAMIDLKPKQVFFIPLIKTKISKVNTLYLVTRMYEKLLWEDGRLPKDAEYRHKVIKEGQVGIKIYRIK